MGLLYSTLVYPYSTVRRHRHDLLNVIKNNNYDLRRHRHDLLNVIHITNYDLLNVIMQGLHKSVKGL